jgi:hypothetical protein
LQLLPTVPSIKSTRSATKPVPTYLRVCLCSSRFTTIVNRNTASKTCGTPPPPDCSVANLQQQQATSKRKLCQTDRMVTSPVRQTLTCSSRPPPPVRARVLPGEAVRPEGRTRGGRGRGAPAVRAGSVALLACARVTPARARPPPRSRGHVSVSPI